MIFSLDFNFSIIYYFIEAQSSFFTYSTKCCCKNYLPRFIIKLNNENSFILKLKRII